MIKTINMTTRLHVQPRPKMKVQQAGLEIDEKLLLLYVHVICVR